MDRLDAMRAFVRVVDTRAFTRAAEAMNVNTASVSRMVQVLEEQINVRLLNRTTRSVSRRARLQRFRRGGRLLSTIPRQ